jgi:predicted O-linked N-acetylglucosamine transferase (SPINDLY family)
MSLKSVAANWLADVAERLVRQRVDPLGHIQRSRGHEPEKVAGAAGLIAQARDRKDSAAWVVAGRASMAVDDFDGALNAFRQAKQLDPNNVASSTGLGDVLLAKGELDDAIAAYRGAVESDPTHSLPAFQSLLFALLCSARATEEEIKEWHMRFASRYEEPLRNQWPSHPNTRDPHRRIRVAYLSGELRDYVTGRFIEPVLARHDRKRFDVHCYFDARLADAFTQRMRRHGGSWHDFSRLDDEALSRHIQSQKIDILVDLSGHAQGNRVLAVARHPAPVQVSYLDYSATTGLESLQFRLTTAALDQPGVADAFYTEALTRLPGTYWLYNPGGPVVEHESVDKPWILFACLNSFYRVNDDALRLWSRILKQVPQSRLALVGVPPGDAQRNVLRKLSRLGIAPGRVELFGFLNHGHYQQIVRATDIALAPFPYNGATTLMDCLWQGTPVVSLRGGPTFRSSMGNCIHSLMGLEDLLAADADRYVKCAVELACDTARRRELRETLRDRMKRSSICDAGALTAAIESAYRKIWADYCAS